MENGKSLAYRIADMAPRDRPRERLQTDGAENLSTPELIAILLRTGSMGENVLQLAGNLLVEFGGLSGIHQASFDLLCRYRGIGPAKAAQIKAALELSGRMHLEGWSQRRTIHSPADVADMVTYEMAGLTNEQLWVVVLNTRCQVIHREKVYSGSVNSSYVRTAEVFRPAILRNGTSIIVIHNHPSGDPTPSPEDIALTRGLVQASRVLDIEILDHLVVGGLKYVSMKERHLGFA